MKNIFIRTFIIMFVVLWVCPVLSQGTQFEFIRNQYLRSGLHYKSWSLDDFNGFEGMTEVAFPVIYSRPITPRIGIDVITSPFFSSGKQVSGKSIDFNNITDTFIRGSYIVGDNLGLVTIGFGIPSGKTRLNLDELSIAGIAANRPLDNPIANFGSGLNLNLGFAMAQEVGSWVLGLGAGYSYRGKFDVRENQKLDPGNEINLTVGVEREFELSRGSSKFLADLIYTNYSQDELAGTPFFEAGDKIVIRSKYLFPIAVFDPVILTVSNRWRLDNKPVNFSSLGLSLTDSALVVDNGNELELRATLVQPRNDRLSIKYILDTKMYGNTASGTEGAFIFGIGGGITLKLSDRLTIDPTLIVSRGKINTGSDSKINVTGFEFSGSVAYRF